MKLKQDDIKNAFYSGYFVKKTQDQLVSWVAGEFRKSSDIKSLKKKQQIQAILEHFSKYFEGLECGFNLYSVQFFVDCEEGYFYDLDKDQIEIINRYHKRDMAVFEEKPKEYWSDFYFNSNWVSIYEVQKDFVQHYRMTNTKLDELSQFKFDNLDNLGVYIARNPAVLFVQGRGIKTLAYLSKNGYEPVEMVGSAQSKHDQLKETYDDYLTQNNVRRMMKALSALDTSPDLFVFGNEVIKEIANYGVKELYCFDEWTHLYSILRLFLFPRRR